jgi:hypothetical protein
MSDVAHLRGAHQSEPFSWPLTQLVPPSHRKLGFLARVGVVAVTFDHESVVFVNNRITWLHFVNLMQ